MIDSEEIFFRTIDPLKREIVLKTNTYNKKIANIDGSNDNKIHGNSHPEVSITDIKDSVENPHIILHATEQILEDGKEITKISETRNKYIRIGYDNEKDKLFAQTTIVEFKKEKEYGEVVTSHFESKVSKIDAKGGVIYDAAKQNL